MAKSTGGTRSGSSSNPTGNGVATTRAGYGYSTAQDIRRAGDYWELQEPVSEALNELREMWDEAADNPNYSLSDVDRVYSKGTTALNMFTAWGETAILSLSGAEREEALKDLRARERDLLEQLDKWRNEAQRRSNGRY